MVFDNRIEEIQKVVYRLFEKFLYSIAKFLGYPDTPGMPIYPLDEKIFDELTRKDFLKKHITQVPPEQEQHPETLTEALFGTFPYTMPVEKHFYEHEAEGYYNFYIKNYKNIYFLPDWLSAYIQINLNITVDHADLELCRDVFFYIVLLYGTIVSLRTTLFWMIMINPYTYPWLLIVDFVDWIYDVLAGILPCFIGVDLAPTLLSVIVGKIADSANHLVFTMPFLPSEGNEVKMIVDGELKNVIQYHYLPYLWYEYPIPAYLRNFWFSERPDILEFMEKNYSQLGVNFRPVVQLTPSDLHLNSSTLGILDIDSIVNSLKDFLNIFII